MIGEVKSDIEIEPIDSETEDYSSALPNYRIFTYPADFTLEVLFNKMKNKNIYFPEFQRGFVWKKIQATRLIESFLVGLPVPAIFLYTEPETQKFLVIDGQQRLKSIYYFIEGYFGEEVEGVRQTFPLTELDEKSEWYNITFDKLSDDQKQKFLNRVLRAFIVEQMDPKGDTSIYHIFERLNTGGTLLTNQEIRNSIYHGKFNDLMKKLNANLNWRHIVGKQKADIRQKDVELILRFLAFYYNLEHYEKPLKEFMNKFMARHQHPSETFLTKTNEIFSHTCDLIYSHLGAKPFHIATGLNPGFFDSVMVNFAKHNNSIPADIKSRYEQLKRDTNFYTLCIKATTDVKVVRNRFNYVEQMLFK